MSETTYYQRNREMILNRAKNCYENDKERLREQGRCKYRNLKRENMEETDIIICLKRRNKD